MVKKIYSAGLVSRRFWFYEFKQYINMLNEGKTDMEIKHLNEEANIFGAVSQNRARDIYNTCKRRTEILGNDMQKLFPELDIDNQKITLLIAVLLLDDLFLEFVGGVYQSQVQKGILTLTNTDYKAFFSEKQRTNDIVSTWKPYTYSRLGSSYRTYLLETGLIRDNKVHDIITPKIIDIKVISWLRDINRWDIAKALIGGN